MSAYVIETRDLCKQFGKERALDNVNLKLEPGKIHGLLGRNGAGKTTLLNILTARLFPDSGEFRVFGEPVFENIPVLRRICFVEEKGRYPVNLRMSEILELAGDLFPDWDEEYAAELIEKFELNPKKKYKELSRGMESSLGLVLGLAARAPLTIFDEPSLGLDAVIRERFYDELIDDAERFPRTVIISTHLIDEIGRLFEDIVVMKKGRVLLQGNADDLRERAFLVSGAPEAVRRAAEGARILREERMGNALIATVLADGPLSAANVEIAPAPMQKLFVALNDGVEEAKGANRS